MLDRKDIPNLRLQAQCLDKIVKDIEEMYESDDTIYKPQAGDCSFIVNARGAIDRIADAIAYNNRACLVCGAELIDGECGPCFEREGTT